MSWKEEEDSLGALSLSVLEERVYHQRWCKAYTAIKGEALTIEVEGLRRTTRQLGREFLLTEHVQRPLSQSCRTFHRNFAQTQIFRNKQAIITTTSI